MVAFPLVLPFVISLVRTFIFLGQAWAEGERGACNVPPPRGPRTRKLGKIYAAMIYRSHASMIKQKKQKKTPTPLFPPVTLFNNNAKCRRQSLPVLPSVRAAR